jgi:hypothetical protein
MHATLLIDHAPSPSTGDAVVVHTRVLCTLTGHAPRTADGQPMTAATERARSGSGSGQSRDAAAQGIAITLSMAAGVRVHAVHSSWPSHTASDGAIVFDLGDLDAHEPKPLLLTLRTEVAALLPGAIAEIARLTVRADVIRANGAVAHRVQHLPITASAHTQGTRQPEIDQAVLLASAAQARTEPATPQRSG